MTLPTYLTDDVLDAIAVGSGQEPDVVREVLDVTAGLGLLAPDGPPEPHEVTDEDVAETAKWLAAMSEHPRYGVDGLGWQTLLTYEGNVDHAHAEALRKAPQDQRAALDNARLILRAAIDRRASEAGS